MLSSISCTVIPEKFHFLKFNSKPFIIARELLVFFAHGCVAARLAQPVRHDGMICLSAIMDAAYQAYESGGESKLPPPDIPE